MTGFRSDLIERIGRNLDLSADDMRRDMREVLGLDGTDRLTLTPDGVVINNERTITPYEVVQLARASRPGARNAPKITIADL
jgi:hypothetical protein